MLVPTYIRYMVYMAKRFSDHEIWSSEQWTHHAPIERILHACVHAILHGLCLLVVWNMNARWSMSMYVMTDKLLICYMEEHCFHCTPRCARHLLFTCQSGKPVELSGGDGWGLGLLRFQIPLPMAVTYKVCILKSLSLKIECCHTTHCVLLQ